MDQKECPACAVEVDANAGVCPICGYEFPKQFTVTVYRQLPPSS